MENLHVVLLLAVLFVTFSDTTGLKSGDDNAQCNDYCKAKAECVIACLKSGDDRAQCNDVCTEKATCMLSCLEEGYDRDKCTNDFRPTVKSEGRGRGRGRCDHCDIGRVSCDSCDGMCSYLTSSGKR